MFHFKDLKLLPVIIFIPFLFYLFWKFSLITKYDDLLAIIVMVSKTKKALFIIYFFLLLQSLKNSGTAFEQENFRITKKSNKFQFFVFKLFYFLRVKRLYSLLNKHINNTFCWFPQIKPAGNPQGGTTG